MKYLGNSFKLRGIKKEFPVVKPGKTITDQTHYYVRIKYNVWPEIYRDQTPIYFPTFKAANLFAENNLSVNKPLIRIFSEDGDLIKIFTYQD